MLLAYIATDNRSVLLEERHRNTGELLRSAVLELGHCNSLSYNPSTKEVYVAQYTYGKKADADPDDENTMDTYGFRTDIKVVDYTTLTIKTSAGFDVAPYSSLTEFGVSGCCYDAINNFLVISTVNKGKTIREIIILTADAKLFVKRYFIFDGNDWTEPKGTFQGVQMAHNGYAYLIDSTYKAIYVLEYITGKPIGIISINDFDDMERPAMELQSISAVDKYDPESNLYVFHGGVLAKGSWFLNAAASLINPFKGLPSLHRPVYLGDSINGYVDPNAVNTQQQGTEDKPYIDPNMMLAVLAHRPTRRVWSLINFLPGQYGIVRARDIDIRINCKTSGGRVEIEDMFIYNSILHIANPVINHGNAVTTSLWVTNATVIDAIEAYSSDIKVYRGSGAYHGNSNSYISKYSASSVTDSNFIASN